jgi:hypothetical protein
MADSKHETIQKLKKQFWETLAKADALRNVAATQRNQEDAARFIQRAEAEEDKAREYLKQIEVLEQSEL